MLTLRDIGRKVGDVLGGHPAKAAPKKPAPKANKALPFYQEQAERARIASQPPAIKRTSAADTFNTLKKNVGHTANDFIVKPAVKTVQMPYAGARLVAAEATHNDQAIKNATTSLHDKALGSFVAPLAQGAVLGGAALAGRSIMNNKTTSPEVKQAQTKDINQGLQEVGFNLRDSAKNTYLKEASLVAQAVATPVLTKGGTAAMKSVAPSAKAAAATAAEKAVVTGKAVAEGNRRLLADEGGFISADLSRKPAEAPTFKHPVTGKPMWEGNDSQMKMQAGAKKALKTGRPMTLGEVIDHPALFEAYPEMRNVRIVGKNLPDGTAASYNRPSQTLSIGKAELKGGNEHLRSDIIHELQHHIQHTEGQVRGGSPEAKAQVLEEMKTQLFEMATKNRAVADYLHQLSNLKYQLQNTTSMIERGQLYNKIIKVQKNQGKVKEIADYQKLDYKYRNTKELGDYAVYRRLAGEADSFNVEARMKWSDQQRKAKPFPQTYDDGYGEVNTSELIKEHADGDKRVEAWLENMGGRDEFDEPIDFKKAPVEGELVTPEEKAINLPKSDSLLGQFKRGLLDSDSPIIDALKAVDKLVGHPRPGDHFSRADRFYYNSNIQRSSHAAANEFFQNSEHVNKAFNGLSKKEGQAFDAYASARTELATARSRGKAFKTSAPREELASIVREGDAQYLPRFKELNSHYRDLAQVLANAGVIDKKKLAQFHANGDYIRLQRDMEDLVQRFPAQGNSIGLRSTVASQKRHGSTRKVQPAGETAAWYTQQVFREARKNQTGIALVDALGDGNLAKRVTAKDASHANVIPVKRNGKQEFYKVPADVKDAALNINPVQLGPAIRIISAPGRLLRAGVTGVNPIFIARNLVKDQADSLINSEARHLTHDPRNIFSGLLNASADTAGLNNNPLYAEFLKHVGETTSYDFTRNQKNATQVISRVRGGRTEGVAQGFKQPIRSIEDFAGTFERSTRFQNFKGGYASGIAKGLTHEQALEHGAMQAWRNSVDFARAGSFGRLINNVIPYWNPATQGVRQMIRTFRNHPVKGPVTALAVVGVPVAAVTAWNLSHPDTAEVYNNIPEYEKENNLVIVPPGTKQNEDGTYDVWKIPLPPGVKNLFQPVRMGLESFYNKTPIDGAKIATDLLGSITGPVNVQNGIGGFAGSFTPQVAKPFVQAYANQDLFSGNQTVPDYMKNAKDANGNPIAPEKMTYQKKGSDGKLHATGSGTSQQIADKLHVSPLKVTKFIKDSGGTVGLELLNATDNAQAKAGTIDKDRIGGESVKQGFKKSFAQSQSIENKNKTEGAKYFDRVKKATETLNESELAAYQALHPSKSNFLGEQTYEKDSAYNPAARLDIYSRFPKVFETDKKLDADSRKAGKVGNPMFDLTTEQLHKVLEKANLPPGAKDPELSNLYTKEWYANYQASNTKYYDAIAKELAKDGKTLGDNGNPYPETPKNVQGTMDYYNSLPKGTGARSAWIKANPGAWGAMQEQFAAIDTWQNNQREKRGLARTEGDEGKDNGFASTDSSSGYGSGGSGGSSGSKAFANVYENTVRSPKVEFKTAINKPATVQITGKGKAAKKKVKVSYKKKK